MASQRHTLRYAAAALGLGALVLLGVNSVAGGPAPAASVVAKAHPAAGPTYSPPKVPSMDFGQTEGGPTTTIAAPAKR